MINVQILPLWLPYWPIHVCWVPGGSTSPRHQIIYKHYSKIGTHLPGVIKWAWLKNRIIMKYLDNDLCPELQIRHFYNPKSTDLIFLHEKIHCGYSLEAPRWGASNEYPKYMFYWKNKKNIMWIPHLIKSYEVLVWSDCMEMQVGSPLFT